ncbi:MAG: hypothetical protein AAFQ67_04150, partial [Pseudomonadota bacterium]
MKAPGFSANATSKPRRQQVIPFVDSDLRVNVCTLGEIAMRAELVVGIGVLLAACGGSEERRQVDPYKDQRADLSGVRGIEMPSEYENNIWLKTQYISRVTILDALEFPPGGIAFYGDSLTVNGEWQRAYPDLNVSNFGIRGDRIVGATARLDQLIRA